VPVIVSDIPVFQEIVSEDENGFFTKLNDVNGLAAVMIQVAEERASFNRQKIAKMAESKYSYPVIGKMFFDWYQKILE
jgi:glycosyltransferase involved in cell wall biosynthesis